MVSTSKLMASIRPTRQVYRPPLSSLPKLLQLPSSRRSPPTLVTREKARHFRTLRTKTSITDPQESRMASLSCPASRSTKSQHASVTVELLRTAAALQGLVSPSELPVEQPRPPSMPMEPEESRGRKGRRSWMELSNEKLGPLSQERGRNKEAMRWLCEREAPSG